jgi:hypothetical protein
MDGSSRGTQRELDFGEVEAVVSGAREIALAHRSLDLERLIGHGGLGGGARRGEILLVAGMDDTGGGSQQA